MFLISSNSSGISFQLLTFSYPFTIRILKTKSIFQYTKLYYTRNAYKESCFMIHFFKISAKIQCYKCVYWLVEVTCRIWIMIKNSQSRVGWQIHIRKSPSGRTTSASVSMSLKHTRHLLISIPNVSYRFSLVKLVPC